MTLLHSDKPRRPVLGARHPLVDQVLTGAGVGTDDPAYWDAQRFGRACLTARDAWADLHRGGRRYSDAQAPGPLVRGPDRGR